MSGFPSTVHSYLRFRPHHPQMSAVSRGEAQEDEDGCQVVSLTARFIQFYSSWMHWAASDHPALLCRHPLLHVRSVCLRHRKAKLSQVTQYYQWNSTPDSSFPSYKESSPLLLSTQILIWSIFLGPSYTYSIPDFDLKFIYLFMNFLLFCWVPVPMLAVRIFKGTTTPSLP